MKKSVYLLFFLSASVLFSQNYEPAQHMFRWGGATGPYIHLSSDTSLFQQKEFMLGVQWGATPKISKALNIKQRDGEIPPDISCFVDSCNYFMPLREQTHNTGGEICNARAVQNKSSFICLLT